jgi:hypothetical protein
LVVVVVVVLLLLGAAWCCCCCLVLLGAAAAVAFWGLGLNPAPHVAQSAPERAGLSRPERAQLFSFCERPAPDNP